MLIVEHASLEEAERGYAEVAAQADALSPFQRWEWIATCGRHLGCTPLVLSARDGDGRWIGVLPLWITGYHGLPLRRVTFIGDPLSDYQGPILQRGRELECARAFLAYLRAQAYRFDLIDLPDVPAPSPLAAAAAVEGLAVHTHRVCPYLQLPPSLAAYRTAHPKLCRSLERQRRKLERDLGAVFDVCPEAEIPVTLERLFTLHQQRWRARGLPGAFAEPRVRRFHRAVAPMLHRRDELRLYRLRVRDQIAAVFYCLRDRESVYYYLSGFDASLARYSPGRLVLMQAIADAIEGGARRFDFLRGDERYKYDFGAEDRATVRIVLAGRTLRGVVARGMNRVERALAVAGSRMRNQLWG
jgi:CelD/BcsL family acetyltransferase involved in cellulose biosynthesis